jgi:hypothetical protein
MHWLYSLRVIAWSNNAYYALSIILVLQLLIAVDWGQAMGTCHSGCGACMGC